MGGKGGWGGGGKNHYANKWKRGFFLYCSFHLNRMTIIALDKSISQPQVTENHLCRRPWSMELHSTQCHAVSVIQYLYLHIGRTPGTCRGSCGVGPGDTHGQCGTS